MGDNSPRLLTVAVTSRALFDLEESHALFESDGVAAYAEFQRQHEDDILGPGVAFPVVRKLLALNQGASPENPRVEVILLSRNSADTGLRIFNSIQHYGLGIIRATFTAGEPTWPYVKPFGTDLFLSANPESVRSALRHGIAAATILPKPPGETAAAAADQIDITRPAGQLRIAFDGDAVIFGDESGGGAWKRLAATSANVPGNRSGGARSVASCRPCIRCRKSSRPAKAHRSAPHW